MMKELTIKQLKKNTNHDDKFLEVSGKIIINFKETISIESLIEDNEGDEYITIEKSLSDYLYKNDFIGYEDNYDSDCINIEHINQVELG